MAFSGSPTFSVKAGLGASGGNTSSANSTGADRLGMAIAHLTGSTVTPDDSNSNLWTLVDSAPQGGGQTLSKYECKNPTVGTGHTFGVIGSGVYCSVVAWGFSGNLTSANYDQKNKNNGGNVSSIQAGSITPTVPNALVIMAVSIGSAETQSIDGGFTEIQEQAYSAGAYFGVMVAFLIQTTAVAVNPTVTPSATCNLSAVISSYKPYTPDATPPTVSITSPSTGGASVSGDLPIVVTCADNNEVVQLDLMVDGVVADTYSGSGITGHTFTLNTLRFTNDAHVIKIRAYDGVNETDSSTITKTFANTFTITGDAKLPSSGSDTYTTNIPDPVWSKDSGGGTIDDETGEYVAPSSGIGVAVLRATGEFTVTQTKNVLYGFPYEHNNGNSRTFDYADLPEGYSYKAQVKSLDEQNNTLGYTDWVEQP